MVLWLCQRLHSCPGETPSFDILMSSRALEILMSAGSSLTCKTIGQGMKVPLIMLLRGRLRKTTFLLLLIIPFFGFCHKPFGCATWQCARSSHSLLKTILLL